jgi:hypothetical protein
MNKRNDPHSPSNLVTEDYEYAYSYDAHPTEGDRRWAMTVLNGLLDEGWRFGQVHGGDTCDHCGARLRYVAVLKHLPTRTLIKVGEQCLDNRFDLASADFHRLRKAASLNRDRMRLADKRAQALEDPTTAEVVAYLDANASRSEFYSSVLSAFNRYGELTERQVAAVLKAKARDAEYAAKREAEAIAHPPAPCPEGRMVVSGEVVKIDVSPTPYGDREVMTVRDDRGFKVWGTQPRALYEAKVGDHVEFTATLERSDRDECFGFFKRPTVK